MISISLTAQNNFIKELLMDSHVLKMNFNPYFVLYTKINSK